jgi:xanthine dehydrogenase YagS FAD-binding subunit
MGPDGSRRVPLREFFMGPNHYTETVLKENEYLTGINVPGHDAGTSQVFLKERIRQSADFALSSVAAVARLSGGVVEDIRIVLGGVAPLPYIAFEAEDRIKGKKPNESLVSKAVEASVEEAKPLPMNGYKVDLTKTLVKRALASILTN